MSDADGMHRRDEPVSASSVATFVYCSRKYRLSSDPPEGHVEPAAVTMRKATGSMYHRHVGVRLGARLLAQRILLLLALAVLTGAVAAWLLS